jgi:hypothetical protein
MPSKVSCPRPHIKPTTIPTKLCCPRPYIRRICGLPALFPDYLSIIWIWSTCRPINVPVQLFTANLLEKTNVRSITWRFHSLTLRAAGLSMTACQRPILRLLYQQQVTRMYDVFWPLELSSKCYLAAFIAIFAFLMWPNIILEFNRYCTYCEISTISEQRFRRSFELLQKSAYTNIIYM